MNPKVITNLAILPVGLRLLCSSSMEEQLSFNIFEYNFFGPEILYLFFLGLNKKIQPMVVLLSFLWLFFSFLSIYYNEEIKDNWFYFINSTDSILPVLIVFSLSSINLYHCRDQLLLILVLIIVQLIYFSTVGSSGSTVPLYGSISRINTTVGSPTTTSVAIIMLGFLVSTLYAKPSIFWISFLCSLITLTKAGMIAFAVIALLRVRYFRGLRVKSLAVFVLVSILTFFGWGYIGSFSHSVENRIERNLSGSGFDSGRIERIEELGPLFSKVGLFYGLGPGSIISHPRMGDRAYETVNARSPHNFLILVFLERGIICFFICITFFYYIFGRFLKDQYFDDKIFWLSVVITVFFIENLMIRMEIGLLFLLTLRFSNHAKKNSPLHVS